MDFEDIISVLFPIVIVGTCMVSFAFIVGKYQYPENIFIRKCGRLNGEVIRNTDGQIVHCVYYRRKVMEFMRKNEEKDKVLEN